MSAAPERPERIVILNDASISRGGATGLSIELATRLATRGQQVVYITGDDGVGSPLHETPVSVQAFCGLSLMKRSALQAATKGLYNRSAAQFVSTWIAEEGRAGDVYHLHGWSQIFTPSVFQALRAVQDRLVVHAHDFFMACPNGGFWDFQKSQVCQRRALSAGCLAQNCDARSYSQKLWRAARHGLRMRNMPFSGAGPMLVTIHDAMEPIFHRAGFSPDWVRTIRNPSEPYLPQPIDTSQNDALLYVGRLTKEKGVTALAAAAHKLGVRFIVAGAGPEAAAIQALCPNAEMKGWVNKDAIRDLAQEARILAMPSTTLEPFGLVAMEAIGSGLPVVLPSHAVLAEEIVQNGAGLAYDPFQPDALYHALAQCFDGRADVAAMSQAAAAAFAVIGNSFENWIDAHLALYAERLSG